MACERTVGIAFLIFLIVCPCRADFGQGANEPYCGVNCVYSAAKYFGNAVDYKSLVKTDYIGDSKGSSFLELLEAARACGLNGAIYKNLTRLGCKNIKMPLRSSSEKQVWDWKIQPLYLDASL